MKFQFCLVFLFIFTQISESPAQSRSNDFSVSSVRDVTHEYKTLKSASVFPTPSPASSNNPLPPLPGDPGAIIPPPSGSTSSLPIPNFDPSIPPLPNPFPYPDSTTGNVSIDSIISIGSRVWDFIVSSKPTADYKSLKGSVVPSGITDWSQLTGWSKNKFSVKIYRVEFKSITGKVGGSFDYRVSFFYGGNYKGKGKYIGQISVVPGNIKLHTDRSIVFRAELLDALNFGTEDDPIAGVQLQVTWSSPTTTRYEMHSAEYFMYATGEVQDITNGN